MKHYGDVSKINGAEVEPVDIITFGAPCQDLSVAGKRMGLKHSAMGDEETTRSGLFFEAIRIIKEMREATNNEYPKYAVYENVPGAFSSNKGNDFHAVLEALCSVCDDTVSIPKPYDKKRTDKLVWNKAGEIVGNNYSIAWRTLDAQYWGVPQRRKRIYLVADFTGRRAGEILFKPESLRGDMQEGDEAGEGATADAVGGVDGSVGAAGVVSKGNGECFIMPERHMSLSIGGGQAGQGYPCVLHRSAGAAGFLSTQGSKAMGIGFEAEQSPTLRAGLNGTDVVIALNDQGGSSMNVESEEISPTLRANSHQHEPVIAFTQNQREEVRDLGDKAGALAAEAGVHQQTYVAQPVIALQGNGIDRADTAGCNGCGWRENESYTLNTVDRHAVCFENHQHGGYKEGCGTLRASGGDYGGGSENLVCYNARGNGDGETACTITGDHQNRITDYTAVAVQKTLAISGKQQSLAASENMANTLGANDWKEPQSVCYKDKPPRRYIIRRLTPTECARLQGFPDFWATLAPYDPADAEFWEEVRKTHAEITGKKYKPVKDIKKWYDKLHTDSAEYKMWGNGIALPNAEYVLHGISEQGVKTLGSLFDGSGGFPLAGVLNGIKPIWASEVEPYPIAVTKSRFEATQEELEET